MKFPMQILILPEVNNFRMQLILWLYLRNISLLIFENNICCIHRPEIKLKIQLEKSNFKTFQMVYINNTEKLYWINPKWIKRFKSIGWVGITSINNCWMAKIQPHLLTFLLKLTICKYWVLQFWPKLQIFNY